MYNEFYYFVMFSDYPLQLLQLMREEMVQSAEHYCCRPGYCPQHLAGKDGDMNRSVMVAEGVQQIGQRKVFSQKN